MFWKMIYNLYQLGRKAKPTKNFRAALSYKLAERYEVLYPETVLEKRGGILILRYTAAVLSVILVLSIGTGVYAYSSPQVNESNPLYKIKVGLEKIEKKLARNPEKQAAVALKQMQKRKQEIEILQAEDKPYEATLTSFNQAQEATLAAAGNVTSEDIRGILIQKVNKENEEVLNRLEEKQILLPAVAQDKIKALIQKQNERVEKILENIREQQEKMLDKDEEKNSNNLPSGLNNPESSGGKKNK